MVGGRWASWGACGRSCRRGRGTPLQQGLEHWRWVQLHRQGALGEPHLTGASTMGEPHGHRLSSRGAAGLWRRWVPFGQRGKQP